MKRTVLIVFSLMLTACAVSPNIEIQPTAAATVTVTAIATDAGQTWSVMDKDFPNDGNVLPTFSSKSEGWVISYWYGAGGGHARFFRTHDGGTTWSQVDIVSSTQDAFSASEPGELAVCNICG